MKKIMMTMAAALMAVSMNAQNMYVGGSLGFTTTSYDGKTTNSTLKFIPEFGVSFNNLMGVGMEIGYSSSTKEATEPKLTNSTFTFAPYFRLTPLHWGKVSVFADGKFALSMNNNEQAGPNDNAVDNKTNTFGIYVQPGFAYNLNDKFTLVSKFGNLLGYRSSKPDADGAKATNTFSFMDLSNNVQFGFYYNF
ncbi:MAG: outer membrane beta-barrel protein [Prevotella sp.]|nr:outer membrane beta-barrel protein [Prevotella sp.]